MPAVRLYRKRGGPSSVKDAEFKGMLQKAHIHLLSFVNRRGRSGVVFRPLTLLVARPRCQEMDALLELPAADRIGALSAHRPFFTNPFGPRAPSCIVMTTRVSMAIMITTRASWGLGQCGSSVADPAVWTADRQMAAGIDHEWSLDAPWCQWTEKG